MRFTVQLDDAADKLRLIEMTKKADDKWADAVHKAYDEVARNLDRERLIKYPMNEGQDDTLNPDTHSQLVDLRHELAELRELQRSASCQRGWLVAAIALLFAGLIIIAWVLI